MTGQMDDGKNMFRGTKYVARLRIIADGGATSATGTNLRVEGANAVTLLLTAGTDYRLQPPDYRGGIPQRVTAAKLAEAAVHPYSELRKRHVTDYQKLFRRVSLDLCGTGLGGDAPQPRLGYMYPRTSGSKPCVTGPPILT